MLKEKINKMKVEAEEIKQGKKDTNA